VDQVPIDTALVRSLVDAQLPEFRTLALRRVRSWGTENAVYRLGNELAVRLPLTSGAAEGLKKEIRWLPVIGRAVTMETPTVAAVGDPGPGYPHPWALTRWLPGRDGLARRTPWTIRDAAVLATFVKELREVAADGFSAPTDPGARGLPLAGRDRAFRSAISRCGGLFDVRRVTAVWEQALAADSWTGHPVLLHADLIPPNMLIRDDRLAAVLDFGTLTIGDPAYDVTAAWHLFDAPARSVYLRMLGADDATRSRARGLVVSGAAIAFPYYLDSNPAMIATARRGMAAVLDDPDAV
jgi:aminoglycoside phosphotransferase (APT) family kinase protein